MGHVPLPAIVRKITSPLPDTSSPTPQPPTPSSRLLQQLGTAATATATAVPTSTNGDHDDAAAGSASSATIGELRELLLAMFETYRHERAIYAAGASLVGESHYRLLKARRAAQGRGRAVRAVEGAALPLRLLGVGEGGQGGRVLWVDEGGRAGPGSGGVAVGRR